MSKIRKIADVVYGWSLFSDIILFRINSELLQILQLQGCHVKVSGNPENYRDSFSSIYFLASFLVFSNLDKISYLMQIPI